MRKPSIAIVLLLNLTGSLSNLRRMDRVNGIYAIIRFV